MADGDLQTILARIEAALGRLESIEPSPTLHEGLAEAYALLDQRHGLLRTRVQQSIERLDGLIGADGGTSA